MPSVAIGEAARQLGISQDTVRRHIRKGLLQAHKESTPQGFVWLVDIRDSPPERPPEGPPHNDPARPGELEALKSLVEVLKGEVEARRREIQELHVLLQQSYTLLPPPKQPWWKRLLGHKKAGA